VLSAVDRAIAAIAEVLVGSSTPTTGTRNAICVMGRSLQTWAIRLDFPPPGGPMTVAHAPNALATILADYFATTGRVRHTLAAAQTAADHAADVRAPAIAAGHVRASLSEWQER
jgi:hypothetical protein